jgi:integrase
MPNYPGRNKGTRRITVFLNGKQHEKVIRGTRADGDRYEAKWRLELEAAGRSDPREDPRFLDFLIRTYKPHAKSHLKDSTWRKVRKYQCDTLAKHLGQVRLSQIALKHVEEYKATRLRSLHRGRPVGPSSVNNELRVLRTILNFARDIGHHVSGLKWKRVPERGKGRVRAWTGEDVQRIYAAARDEAPELVPMLVFLVNTGCRKGEAIAAEWSWVDDGAGMLRIPSNEVWQPKNGLPREVPISDAVKAVLAGPPAHPKYLFPSRLGGRYAEFPKDAWSRVRERAGVSGGPHTTRHTFASHFLQARPDLFLLAQVLGHSHQRVTELYSHLLPDHLARARNAVNIAPALQSLAGSLAEGSK